MPSPPGGFAFGPYRLDAGGQRLCRGDEPVALSPRRLVLLHMLVTHAGKVVSKDDLVSAAWRDVIVGDNSLEQEIRKLRLCLDPDHPLRYIANAKRVGYRFVEPVTTIVPRGSDADIDAAMAPHRAAMESRAALETLQLDRIPGARSAYEQRVAHRGDDPRAHIGLATACLEQYEATRTDASPDTAALQRAEHHARQALHLDMDAAHAWATLGQVLERMGDRTRAIAALKKAVELEPEEWTHYLRLGWIAWGRERLDAARRLLALMPGSAAGHWLVASVFVARHALVDAEREVDAAVSAMARPTVATHAFPAIAVHLLKGLLLACRGRGTAADPPAYEDALEAFARELAVGPRGHIYRRETEANTWYAIGACELRRGNRSIAAHAFTQATLSMPTHARAGAGLALLQPRGHRHADARDAPPVDQAVGQAALLVADDDRAGAARVVGEALRAAPAGNAGWTIPIDPLLDIPWRQRDAGPWADVLAVLRDRAR